MTWRIRFERTAASEFRKLDHQARRRIRDFVQRELETSDDPRRFRKPLQGNLATFWRYRVGDYRLFCDIRDTELVILIVRIAHPGRVYR